MSRAPRRGFTLLELAVVLAIVAVTFAILFPRLPGVQESRTDAALRRLAGAVQVLHEEAAFKKKA